MTTKLQVPMDKDVRDGLERRAKALGFDSAQAYIRVWAKAEIEGRSVDFGTPSVALSPAAAKRYAGMVRELEAEKASGTAQEFNSVADLMQDLGA